MITKRTMLGWAAALLATGLAFGQETSEQPQSRPSDTGRARLAEAEAMVDALKGVRGPERLDGMREAAEAYEAVARDFASESPTVTRATWEAAECWRKASELEKASDAYGRVLSGEPGRYRQRALFGRASMLRRLKDYDGAIEMYRQAGALEVEGVRAHDARVWVARVLELRGDREEALAAYRSAVDAAVGPRRTIEAADALAKALIRSGDLDGAAAAIQRADDAARAAIEAGGQEGQRIERALEGMGARGQLRRARDKADGTAEDAVKLERDRKSSGG